MRERSDDMKRLYKATHVRIIVPEDLILELRGTSDNTSYYWSKTTPIILDAGAHVWVKEDKDSFPFPGVAQIEYDGDKCDFRGECLFRIPIEWCTFLTPKEAKKAMD